MNRRLCLTMRPDADRHRVSRRNVLRCVVLATGGMVTRGLMAQDQAPRIGLLAPGDRGEDIEGFMDGMRELGYVDGRNLSVVYREAKGRNEALGPLLMEFVSLKVSVIVTGGTAAARTARQMNLSTPVVIGAMTDPVESGVAMSLARPGGNITGLSLATGDDFGGKYLELLSELRPGMRRVAVLYHLARPAELQAMQREAPRFGIELVSMQVGSKVELAESFQRIASQHIDAAVVITDPFTFAERQRIIALASAKRLPVIYGLAAFVDAGGLLAYGPSLRERWHRAATYVDKILKGAKPAELAIEQPTRFELVINAKTARELGLTIPAMLGMRVDRVVN